MIFGANRGQLDDAQKVARVQWEQVCEHWSDPVQRQHREAIIEPLDHQVSHVLRSVDQLITVIANMRREIDFQQNS